MVEGTPGKPYGHRMAHFNMVECNMKQRFVFFAFFTGEFLRTVFAKMASDKYFVWI